LELNFAKNWAFESFWESCLYFFTSSELQGKMSIIDAKHEGVETDLALISIEESHARLARDLIVESTLQAIVNIVCGTDSAILVSHTCL
jgi:hypothetical protein